MKGMRIKEDLCICVCARALNPTGCGQVTGRRAAVQLRYHSAAAPPPSDTQGEAPVKNAPFGCAFDARQTFETLRQTPPP